MLCARIAVAQFTSTFLMVQVKLIISNVFFVLRFGPLVGQWTMRYEAKHSYFKKLIQNLGNFKNVSWSLAKRHQYLSCYYHQADEFLNHDDMEVGPGMHI